MKYTIAELAQQRESLQKLANDSVSGSVKRWAQILLGVSSGLSKRAVSRQVKCGRETIQTALAKFEAGEVEGLLDRRK